MRDRSISIVATGAIRSNLDILSSDLVGLTLLTSHMIEIGTGKVYIGVLTFIDLNNEKGYLSFIPLKSAYRENGS